MTPETLMLIYIIIAVLEYIRGITAAYVNEGYQTCFGTWLCWDFKIATWFFPALFWPITYIAMMFCAIHRRF